MDENEKPEIDRTNSEVNVEPLVIRQIYNGEETIGKTVAKTNYFSVDNSYALLFTDGSFIMFYAHSGYEGDVDIEIANKYEDYHLRDLGIITLEEYERRKQLEAQQRKAARDKQDWDKLQELRNKFGV